MVEAIAYFFEILFSLIVVGMIVYVIADKIVHLVGIGIFVLILVKLFGL